jgi:hypothetical protein
MSISPINNCSDQIYARLFTHIDVATSLLLKQDLVDAEFVREQNQRIFTKLNAIQDAALMRTPASLGSDACLGGAALAHSCPLYLGLPRQGPPKKPVWA